MIDPEELRALAIMLSPDLPLVPQHAEQLCRDAADELERLREQLEKAEAVCRGVESFYCYGQNPQMDDAYRLAMIVNRAKGGGDGRLR